MIIKCANCNEFVKIPESILKSEKPQFICHLCNRWQEIKIVRFIHEEEGKTENSNNSALGSDQNET